jgi:hypothetical protein
MINKINKEKRRSSPARSSIRTSDRELRRTPNKNRTGHTRDLLNEITGMTDWLYILHKIELIHWGERKLKLADK